MLTKAYYPHAIILSSGNVCHLASVSPSHNYRELNEACAGDFGPDKLGLEFASPSIDFTTGEIKAILDAVDKSGSGDENIARDFSAGNVDIEYRAGKNRGTRYGVAESESLRGRLTSNALLYWDTINASQGQVATIQCRLVTAWDGTNDPLIFTNGVAVTASLAVGDLYSMGPLTWDIGAGEANISGVTNVTYSNNVELETIPSDGAEFDTYQGIKMIRPVVTFRSNDASLLDTIPERGLSVSAFTGYLKKYAEDTIYAPTASGDHHIKISNGDAFAVANEVSGSPGEVDVTVRFRKSSGDFFTLDTTSNIILP